MLRNRAGEMVKLSDFLKKPGLDNPKRQGPSGTGRTARPRRSSIDDKNRAAAAANAAFGGSGQYSGRQFSPVRDRTSFLGRPDDHLPSGRTSSPRRRDSSPRRRDSSPRRRDSSPRRHSSPVRGNGQISRARGTSQSRAPRHEPSPSNASTLVGIKNIGELRFPKSLPVDGPHLYGDTQLVEPQEDHAAPVHPHSHSLSDLPSNLNRPASRDGGQYPPELRDGINYRSHWSPQTSEKASSDMQDMQAEVSRHLQHIDLLQTENRALQEEILDRTRALHQWDEVYSRQKSEGDDLKAELARLKDDHEKNLQNLRDKHKKDISDYRAYHEETERKLRKDHDNKLSKQEANHQMSLQNLRDQHKSDLQEQEDYRHQTLQTLNNDVQLQLSKQESDHQKTLQDLDDKHADDLARQKQEAKAKSDSHLKELYKYESHVNHLKAKIEAQQSSHEQEMAGLRHKQVDEIQALQKSHGLAAGEQQRKFEGSTLEYQKLLEELQSECDKLVKDRSRQKKDHEAMISALETNFKAEARQLRQEFEEKLQQQKSDYALQMQNQRIYHTTESEKITASYESQMQSLMEDSRAKLQKTRDYYEDSMRMQGERHQSLVNQEREEATQMIASLRPETGDSIRQLTDSELKIQFQKLKLLVQVITEPFNLGAVSIPQDSPLDHTQFLQREGKNMLRFLLRSLVWERIADGFFSAPFGFGAFGSGDGKRVLIELYWSWRSLFAHPGGAGTGTDRPSPAETNLDIFSRSKDANRWRSATFSSIMSAVRDGKKSPADGDEPAPLTPFAMNRAKVEADILKVFEEITTVEAVDQIKEKVSEIACLAGELALEVGVHRANVGLSLPSSGESVQIGQDFVDCEDGHGAQGELETVDLLVCPQLFKIGDGRGEGSPSAPKSICPGEVFPVRSMPA